MTLERFLPLDELWDGEMRGVVSQHPGHQRVLLVRSGDEVFAYLDRCCHQGVALSTGELRDGRIICPAHRWEFEARSGQGLNPRGVALKRLGVELKEGWVHVDLDA